MEKTLRSCADQIVEASIRAVLPDEAVRRALKDFHRKGARCWWPPEKPHGRWHMLPLPCWGMWTAVWS